MDGLLIIDKPAGWTSHDVVARVRRLLKIKRVGHTGTLDPFATGVLVLMSGRATRLAQFLSGDAKEYEATVRFGHATDTGDVTGTPRIMRDDEREAVAGRMRSWSEQEIEAALAAHRGHIEQVPPMYSAKKIGGQKLYELARRGETVERAARAVTIHELEAVGRAGYLLTWHTNGTCDLSIRVNCSAGTYVRVLAETIGERLGAGAHLACLRRTRAGDFSLKDAVTVDQLERMAEAGTVASALLSPARALSSMPFVHLTAVEARRAMNGVALGLRSEGAAPYAEGERVRMLDESGNLLAVGVYDSASVSLRPQVVMALEK